LLPLLFGAGEPGREILHPVAVTIFGGLVSSTLLARLVTPVMYKLLPPAIEPEKKVAATFSESASVTL